MTPLSTQALFGIGGWAPPFFGRLDPWEIAVGLVGVVLGLWFVKHVAEHWTQADGDQTKGVGLVLAGVLALGNGTARADESATSGPSQTIVLRGSVDGLYAYNTNRPLDHANFFPGTGTSAKRDNELALNLAQVDLVVEPKPVGFVLSLGFGNSTEVVHAGEPVGVTTSPDVWRHVLQASMQWHTGAGKGLLVEAGIFPSHIGLESFATKDNWNYTRSWLGELSPYYQTGVKLAYPFGGGWSGQLHLLNGWQNIGDNNRGKSIGAQIAYDATRYSVKVNGIAGAERAEGSDIRTMGDIVATYKATPALSLGFSFDAASEGRPTGSAASWYGGGLYGRYAPPESRTALALRAEYYSDKEGAISGIGQTLKEITATLEHRPVSSLILKLEGRYDRSSAPAFASDSAGPDGAPLRKRNQFLVLVGAVATF